MVRPGRWPGSRAGSQSGMGRPGQAGMARQAAARQVAARQVAARQPGMARQTARHGQAGS